MVIADHPLHGSRRTALPYRALALRHDRKRHRRPWVHDAGARNKTVDQPLHSLPLHVASLAASPEGSVPQAVHFFAKPSDGHAFPAMP